MVTIAFHSGEDRIIKEYFNNLKESGKAKFIEKLLKPKSSEIDINKRSHSAKLRVIEKI
jgi:16S rRNA (cytosine1402-N4)-methyltransferase